jgi:hypothetical protein
VAGTVHLAGQELEVGPAAGGDDNDFAVEHDVSRRGEAVELVEPVHPFAAGPGPQPQSGRFHLGQAAEPVDFGLVDPRFAARRFGRRRGEHRSVRRSHASRKRNLMGWQR